MLGASSHRVGRSCVARGRGAVERAWQLLKLGEDCNQVRPARRTPRPGSVLAPISPRYELENPVLYVRAAPPCPQGLVW